MSKEPNVTRIPAKVEWLRNAVGTYLEKQQFNDKITVDVTGPQLVNGPDPGNPQQMVLQNGWIVMITLEHNMLVGQDPVGASLPIAGVMPPLMAFQRAAEMCLERCRQVRDEANTAGSPENLVAQSQGQLPPGLLGKQL